MTPSLPEPGGEAREIVAPDGQADVVHPGRGRGGLAGGQRQQVDEVAPRPELDQPGALVHVVELEAEDGRVEALRGGLVGHAEDHVVELQDLPAVDDRQGCRSRYDAALAAGWTSLPPTSREWRRPAVPCSPAAAAQVEGEGERAR